VVSHTVPTIADLHRDPREVATALPTWQRGDAAEAVAETLAVSARTVFTRAYTAWIWTGAGPGGRPGWVLPIPATDTERFAPHGSMTVLTRCLRAARECGAHPAGIRLLDWDGFTALDLPGADAALAELALADAHPPPGRIALARLPESVEVDGPPLDLEATPGDGRGGLVTVARAMRTHPVPIALALLDQGWGLEEDDYPQDVVELLRHRGLEGPPLVPRAASLAIGDDPCPRRRHARRVLRRLLHKRKIGPQYHTEFDHVARGAPPEDRADALQIGEALIRAGLLGEKPSVGQRHVYLRREALPRIHALIDRGETTDPVLAAEWTAPAPGDT